MRVFIVGVAGGTGLRLARQLRDKGDEVGGLLRRQEEESKLAALGINAAIGDIADIDVNDLANAMRGSDVIVFCAGAGGGGKAKTEAVDGEGVSRSIGAAQLAGVKRFLLVSVFPEAWRERHMDDDFEHYIAVKKRADIALSQSDLDWVILRPSALKNDAGTGRVSLGVAEVHTEISRDDVAAVLAELVHTPGIRRKILELREGSMPIEPAVATQMVW